jgi:protein involved in polysaccharide export with SLBB domain
MTVLQRREISNTTDRPDEQHALRPAGSHSPRWTFRRPFMAFLLLSSAPLTLGVLISIPPARLAEGFKTLTAIRAHTLSSIGLRSEQSRPSAGEATNVTGTFPSPAARALIPGTDRSVLAYGDRLKITFYESIGVALEGRQGGTDQAIATIFPRMDLSAEYSVDEGGSLAIPRLGQFAVAGQTITAVRSALAAAFEQAIGRPSDVHLTVVERQPIYVLGTVRNAGVFKHAPGMTALQALANAGGIDSGIADTSKTIESIRETQRLLQTETRLDRLLVSQARLIALRDDLDSLTLPANIASRLSETASRDALKSLITGAQATLTVERARYQHQVSLAERQVGVARVEVGAQNMHTAQLTALLARKADRLRDLEGIATHGSVSSLRLTDAGVDISEIVARREDIRVGLAQSERRLVEAEIALAKIQLDHSAGIDKELSSTQQEIEDCTHAIASMRAVINVLRDNGLRIDPATAGTAFLTITRRVADGIVVEPATESSALLPGDVVQVNSARRVDAKGAASVQNVTQMQR